MVNENPTPLPDHLKEKDKELSELFYKNNELFDKQIVYLAAGALGLSLAFIGNVVKDISSSYCIWMLILGWSLLVLSLLLMVVSYPIASHYLSKTINEIRELKYDYDKENERGTFLRYCGYLVFGLVVLGISFIMLYAIINVYSAHGTV